MVALVNTQKWVKLCIVLILCNMGFIWGNSLLPAEASAAISNFVYSLLRPFFSGEGTQVSQGTGLLRKLAHLAEFTCLGILWCWYLLMGRKNPFWGLLPGLCTACVDEAIQCFVPGRGPRITDILIDLAGFSLGIGMMYLIQFIHKWRNKK